MLPFALELEISVMEQLYAISQPFETGKLFGTVQFVSDGQTEMKF
jgi:hypothetical protein